MALGHRSRGVVGLDLAGDDDMIDADHPDDPRNVAAFQFAFNHSIHRTVQAGALGPAANVKAAMEVVQSFEPFQCIDP